MRDHRRRRQRPRRAVRLRGGRGRRPARRRGAGADRRHRALPHRHLAARTRLPAEMFPRVLRPRGLGRRRGGRRGRRPASRSATTSCSASPPAAPARGCRCRAGRLLRADDDCSTTWASGWTARRRTRRDAGPVYGHFFGQSVASRSTRSPLASSVVVVDKALDLTPLRAVRLRLHGRLRLGAQRAEARARGQRRRYGVGAVGLAAVAAAKASGAATIVAVDLMPSRLEAAAAYGAVGDVTRRSSARPPSVDKVKELDRRRAPTYGVETHRRPLGRSRRPRRRCACQGTPRRCLGLDDEPAGVPGRRDRHPAERQGRPRLGRGRLATRRRWCRGCSGSTLRATSRSRTCVTTYPFAEINPRSTTSSPGRSSSPSWSGDLHDQQVHHVDHRAVADRLVDVVGDRVGLVGEEAAAHALLDVAAARPRRRRGWRSRGRAGRAACRPGRSG